jgi:ATP-dependent Clp protease adapter protein ClpS
MARSKRYSVVVYDDDFHQIDDVIDAFRKLFGYESIQALSCATLVQQRGSYACKSFTDSSMARTVAKHLQNLDFKVEVVCSK